MKEQKSLSDAELKHAFEEAMVRTRNDMGGNGAAQMLRMLSGTVRELQALGADVSITVSADSHSNAYDMIYTTSGPADKGSTNIRAHGFIRSGESSHLFAVAIQYNGEPVQRIYLSTFNTSYEGGRLQATDGGTQRARIPGAAYDFIADETALARLQSRIASICAENAVVLECDAGNVFNQPVAPPKPTGRLKL